ncbi:hypothetical protein OJ252_884 [Cryptosporidium canis]|uniref:Inositol-pentakisphosphate 2-kinase n=1 Tax=Cryptosporidium canis TaxID=195482 RepID=A0ABQ8PA82_9CRYT|nr:hypothetical protein OJ252_884 [Cryptosporidium canis]
MQVFPKNWKFFEVNFNEAKWDFLVDGGMHSVFSTHSNIKLSFNKCLQSCQLDTSRVFNSSVISVFRGQHNRNVAEFEITMSFFILKIEKKSTSQIGHLIDKIIFESGLNRTKLSEHTVSPRVPLIFIHNGQFRLGWFEPNSSITNIPVSPLNTCSCHTQTARQSFNLEFKPKCALPLLTEDFALYRVLQKLVRGSSWLLRCSGIALDTFDEEFELLLRYRRLCGAKDIPCQITVQKLSANGSFEDFYSPANLFFSRSRGQLFSEFLKALNVSGKIIQNNSIINVKNLTKDDQITETLQNEIPIFSDSLSYFPHIFHKLILCQTFCSGQQILAYYIYIVLESIMPSCNIQRLINAHTMDISTKMDEMDVSDYTPISLEFYNNRVIENFQFGLFYLTKLMFYINKRYEDKDNLRKYTDEIFERDSSFRKAIQDATKWLSNFLFGRSVCDCSLIISIMYTSKDCVCYDHSDFKLIKTFNHHKRSHNDESTNVLARVKIIDISKKPLEKISYWKNQFIDLIKKLLVHYKSKKRNETQIQR